MTGGCWRRAALCGLVMCGLWGCAADRVTGVGAPNSGLRFVGDTPSSHPACIFSVEGIDDQRGRTDLGDIGRTRVGGEGFMDWFAARLADMPGHASEPSARRIKVVVLKAYVHGLGTLKSAQLVVRVHFHPGLDVKTYRGVDATMNWSSAEGEIQSAFDRAWADLARQIGRDLAAQCSS